MGFFKSLFSSQPKDASAEEGRKNEEKNFDILKYDGVRAIWDGKVLKSRSGKIINAPTKFINELPDFALDGELWSGVGEFEFIASTVLDETPDDRAWEKIKDDLIASEKSIKEEGTISAEEMRKELGI